MKKTVYLTIDDGPTEFTPRLLEELISRNIPAVLFFIGERMSLRPEMVIAAIQQGFVIGNHSWSHPHFDKISLAEAKAEISKTEVLIEQLYLQAKVNRPAKYFRFPYGDAGDGRQGKLGFTDIAWTASKGKKIQQFLKEEGFEAPTMSQLALDALWRTKLADRIDWSWTFDVMEWSLLLQQPVGKVARPTDVLQRLSAEQPIDVRNTRRNDPRWRLSNASEIILIHDNPKSEQIVLDVLQVLSQLPFSFQLPFATSEPN